MHLETNRCRTRAAASNNPRALTGVDGRSATARRFRDLVDDITAPMGGFTSLPAGQRAQARQAAAMMLRSEQLQAAIVRGETINDDEFLRLSSETRRLLAALGSNLFSFMALGE